MGAITGTLSGDDGTIIKEPLSPYTSFPLHR